MTEGFFALGGVALLWLLQRISGWLDRRHKERERRRDAALQVYEELDVVMAANHKAAGLAARIAQEGSTIAPGEYAAVHLGRLRGLLSIYFPDSMSMFKSYDDQLLEHGKFFREMVKDPDGKLTTPENIRGAGFGYGVLVNTQTTKLLTDVRRYMDEHSNQLL